MLKKRKIYLSKMINSLKIALVICCFLIVGCKSAKRIGSNGELNSAMTSKELVKKHNKQHTKFKTLQAKVKVQYQQGEDEQSHTITLRMERDKAIWINSAFSVVRAMITPEKVGYYNKLDNTYFDGDFTLISELLGTELSFENIQNLLMGEALFNLNGETFSSDLHEQSYVLYPENQSTLFEIFYLLNPTHFRMDSQQVAQSLEQRMLQVDYLNYQEVEKEILPQNVKIIALEPDLETIIKMEFKSVTLNNELRFPFRIPSGFDKIEIK